MNGPDAGAESTGPFQRITRYQIGLVVMLGAVGFFDSYATSFRYKMTTYVRQDFEVDIGTMAGLFSWLYLASCAALAVRLLADLVGRRFVLFASMAGLCTLQWLTGYAENLTQYLWLMAGCALFYKCDLWLLVLSEEAPSQRRGLFMGLAVVIAGTGALVQGVLIAGMGEAADAWRSVARFGLFGVILSLVVLAYVRETRHFVQMRARRRRVVDWSVLWRPFQGASLRPLMLVAVLKMVLMGGAWTTISILETEFLRVDNGFDTTRVGWLTTGDAIAIPLGWLLAGLLSDAIGRVRTSVLLAAFWVAALLCFVLLPRGSTEVMVLSIAHNFVSAGLFAILRLVSFELFPTDHRSTASAWTDIFTVLFAAANSQLIRWLTQGSPDGGLGVPVGHVILGVALVIPVLLPLYRLLPETAGRRLGE